MTQLFLALWDRVSLWWHGPMLVEPVCAEPEPIPAPLRIITPRVPKPPKEHTGVEWCFRDTILDRLDDYFDCLRRLKSKDPDAYETFGRIGFAVTPMVLNPSAEKAGKAYAEMVPRSLGGVLLTADEDDTKTIYPSFVYFTKMGHPGGVEAAHGDIYRLTCVYDDRGRCRGWTVPMTCHVACEPDGTIKLLRERVISRSEVRSGKDRFWFRTVNWNYPFWLHDVSVDHQRTPEQWAQWLFGMAFYTYDAALEKIQIRAKRASMVAMFSIVLPTAKAFFRDRDVDAAVDGKRKRIFHSVIEHARVLADGRETTVKAHYRGARDFQWKTYGVHIVLPDVKADVTISAVYEEDSTPDEMVPLSAVAEQMEQVLAQ